MSSESPYRQQSNGPDARAVAPQPTPRGYDDDIILGTAGCLSIVVLAIGAVIGCGILFMWLLGNMAS